VMDLLNLMGNKIVVLDDEIALPYDNGTIIEESKTEKAHIILCHFPNRGPPWADDGQYVCWIVHPTSGCVAGDYETNKTRATSLFNLRVKKENR
jgi:hypothetical protein